MKKILALSIVAVMMMLFCSCSSDASIVGDWTAEISESGITVTTTYTFNEDNTGKISVMGVDVKFTYEIDGDKITIKSEALGEEVNETMTYSLDGDKLTITSEGETLEFTRVKE